MHVSTERLVLREFEPGDWRDLLAWQRDPRYLRFYPWTGRSEEEVREFVQMFIGWRAEKPRRRFQLAITLANNGELIGSCGLRRKPGNEREADIGFELAPERWGNGYATEAARAMVDFGFRELGLHRISSWCIAENLASARVLERLGLRQEGRLRENEHFKGRCWDTLLFGMLEDEWRAAGGG
jgi:ribosomal-protein-alanine N-acetyltransferase